MAKSFREYYNTLSETDKNEIEKRVMAHFLKGHSKKDILSGFYEVISKVKKRPVSFWDNME